MSLHSCSAVAAVLNDPDSGSFWSQCADGWSDGGAGAVVYECAGSTSPGDAYWLGCSVEWTLAVEEPGEPPGFDPATALGLFVSGFSICFAFWAMGKVPALVMKVLR